jgi:cell division protein FtsI (penicillin-binding protein 3)
LPAGDRVIDRIQRVLTRTEHRAPVEPGGNADLAAWRSLLKRRILVAAAILGLWALAIEVRLAWLQVHEHADLVMKASRQQMRRIPTPAERGDIVDRKGRVLATSVDADSIFAAPSEIDNPDETVAKLCGAFGDCTAKERQTLGDHLRKGWTWVRRQVSSDERHRVEALNLDGIGFRKESRRFYPNTELAAHLLGFVGVDNIGLSGIEAAYDSRIRGQGGEVLIQTDARQHAFSTRVTRLPTAGSTIELTIDEFLQHLAERELAAGVAANHAAGGSAIIMNPHTGEILALANVPTFNPNSYRDSQPSDLRNRAVQDLYEPGSTFKLVTASAAIEERVMPLDTMIDTNPGQIRIDNSRIVHDMKNHGVLSFSDVIVESSNVGAIKIGFKVGTDRMTDYVQRYGFGHPVSPDFPSESSGIVWKREKMTDSALASLSMGYQVGVTPLQMAAAVSAVANRGERVEPRVVRAIYRDNRRFGVPTKTVQRTTSADTAAALTTIMEGVVERGTARAAQIPGYTIAGKTGTAAKLIDGRYSHSEYNASFVGFIPSRDPAVTIIVVIDSPHGSGYTGGAVSAPVFKRIAESTLRYLGIGPTINPSPAVLVARDSDDMKVPASTRATQPAVSLVADAAPGTIPDLRGLSAREAVRTLVKLGLVARVTGDGVVVTQEPAAGMPLEQGGICRLVLARMARRGESSP